MTATTNAMDPSGTPFASAIHPERQVHLKNYIFFQEVDTGVLFDAGARSFVLQGKGIYPFVARIISLMDAGATVGQIAGRVPVSLSRLFRKMLDALHEYDMLLDKIDDPDLTALLDSSARFLEFYKYLQDRLPAERCRGAFDFWRRSACMLIGDGYALKASANAIASTGVGRLTIYLADGKGRVTEEELAASMATCGVPGQIRHIRRGWPSADDVGTHAVLVLASDAEDGLHRACSAQASSDLKGIPFIAAGCLDGRAFVAPPRHGAEVGLEDLLQWATSADHAHSPVSLAVMGTIAAQHAIQYVCGIEVDQLRHHAYEVTPHLDISRRPVIPAPNLRPLQTLIRPEYISRIDVPTDRTMGTYETQRVRLDPWFDPITGPFSALASAGLVQMPLYHDAIGVRFPKTAYRAPETVLGWGLNAEEAGERALSLAISRLATAAVAGASATLRDNMSTAFDEASWRAIATARAVAADNRFAHQWRCAWIDPGKVDDGTAQMLVRLVTFLGVPPLRLLLHWHPGAPSCIGRCYLGETLAGSACAPRPIDALRDAIGLACSARQIADPSYWRGAPPAPVPPGSAPWAVAPALDTAGGEAPAGIRLHRITALGLPGDVFCGYATLSTEPSL
jgi:hypothetical protein